MKKNIIILLVLGVVFGKGNKDTSASEKIPNIETELLMLPLLALQRVEMHISKYMNSSMSIGVVLGYVIPYDWLVNFRDSYNPPKKYGYRVGIVATDHVFYNSQSCIYMKPMFFLSYLNKKDVSWEKKLYTIGGVVIMGIKSFLGPKGFFRIHPNLFVSLYGGISVDYYFYYFYDYFFHLNKYYSYLYPNIVVGGSIGYLFKRKKT